MNKKIDIKLLTKKWENKKVGVIDYGIYRIKKLIKKEIKR